MGQEEALITRPFPVAAPLSGSSQGLGGFPAQRNAKNKGSPPDGSNPPPPPDPASGPSSHFPSLSWQQPSEVLRFQPAHRAHVACLLAPLTFLVHLMLPAYIHPVFPPHPTPEAPWQTLLLPCVSSYRSSSPCRPGETQMPPLWGSCWILRAGHLHRLLSAPASLASNHLFEVFHIRHDENLWPRTCAGYA